MNNIQYLATKLIKVKNCLSPEMMKEIFVFQENENYNLRSGSHLAQNNIRTAQSGTQSASNLGAKFWNLLPEDIKIVLPSLFSKMKLENGSLKNVH